MDGKRWLKVNRSLLGETALLGVLAMLTVGAAPHWGMVGNFLAGMEANNLGALRERFRNHGEVLRNEDLAKAAGRTVRKTLEERIIPQFPELRAALQGLADGVEAYWLERVQGINVFETLQEEQLYDLFSQAPERFSNYQVLKADEWQELSEDLVAWGYGRGMLPGERAKYNDVVVALAGELAANFGKYLRQVLKDDPKAFAGMVFDLHGATLAKIEEIQQYLPKLAHREDVEQVLSILEENFLRQTRQLERMEGKIDRLAGGEGATAAPRSRLFNVPSLPLKFLPRLEEVEAIKAKLLGTESQTLVMTGVAQRVGVQGMGGIGKSVLAAAVARDEAVGARFPDGVLWVTLGQEPNLITRLVDCVAYFTGTRLFFEDVAQGKAALAQQLEERVCLLVLDDVWQMSHAEAFYGLGPRCQLLLTTRDGRLVRGLAAQGHEVGLLSEEQGLGLVAQWAGEHPEGLPTEAVEVVQECGYLPLAVAMAGAMVCGNGANRWRNVLEKLRSADLARIAYKFPDYPNYPNLLKVLEASVDALASEDIPDIAPRYLDLAIFPKGTPIPEGVLEIFWGAIGLDALAVQDVVDCLVAKSLLLRDELGRLNLHDLQVDYVRQKAGDLTARQEQFFAAYGQRYPEGYHEATADEYFGRYAIRHHLQVCPHHIPPLLLDFRWLQGKIERLGVGAVLADFEAVPEAVASRDLGLVGEAVRLSAHVVQQDPSQLAGQLLGRLLSFAEMTPPQPPYRYFWERIPGIGQHLPKYPPTPQRETFPAITQLLTQAQQCQRKPWIRPLFPNLTPPGGPLIRTLTGHGDSVSAVAISPDGQRVVSGSLDNTLKVWNLATGEEERTLTGHGDSVNAVAISPDGQRVVSSSRDKTLKIWKLVTGKEERTLTGHDGSVNAIAISPDGQWVVSGSWDNTLKVWNLVTGEEERTLSGHGGSVTAVAISPDGQRVVSGSVDKTLKVWNLATGKEERTLTGHGGWVSAVTISPDGQRVVSGSQDKTLKVWNLATGEEELTLTGHGGWVSAVTISPDGQRVMSGSLGKTLKVWNLATGKEERTLTGHNGSVSAVAISLDGQRVVSGSVDNTLKIWNLSTGEEELTLTGHGSSVYAVAISPDGQRVVSGSKDKTLKVWNLSTGEEERTFTVHDDGISEVAISPDGQRVVLHSIDNTLKVWNLVTGEEERTLTLIGHFGSVNAVAISPDGQRMVSGSLLELDGTLKVWNLATGKEEHTLIGHGGLVNAIAISPDGQWVVSGSWDKTLKVWNLSTGEEERTLTGHRDWVCAVAVSPDGQRVVSGSRDKTLKVWNVATGEEERTLTGHSWPVLAVAISPDGQRVVSGSVDTLKVWNLVRGEEIACFPADAALECCAIAPDGVTVVAGDYVGRVHFLRLAGFPSP